MSQHATFPCHRYSIPMIQGSHRRPGLLLFIVKRLFFTYLLIMHMKIFGTALVKKYLLRRSVIAGVVFAFGTFFLVNYATSHSGGITGQTNKAGDGQGCTCHCANSSNNTTVTITTTSTSFQVNQTYTFTVTVSNSGETNGGVDIACDNGSLAAGNDGLQKPAGQPQLTHTAPKALPATWTFTYTAPATAGTDHIYAAGNAVNADGTNSCLDEWNFANSYAITVTSPTKAFTVSTSTISFGSKRVGSSTNQTMSINSVGPDAALTISSSPLSLGIHYSNSPTGANRSISVGSSETETITFSPSVRGTLYDTLTINNDATTTTDQHKKIFISGTGINAVFTGPSTLSFDKVRVGNTKQLTYSFTNTGDDTLFLSAPSLSGTGFSFVGSPTSQNILPGAGGSFTVKFSPNVKQVYTGTLTITAQNNVAVPAISLGGVGTSPIISTATSNYDLGVTLVGSILTGSLQVTNSGDDTLHVTGVSIPTTQQGAKFTLSNGASGFTLLPGASTYLGFSYTSSTESFDNATMVINSDDPAATTKQVSLSARSGLPKMSLDTKDTIDFGSVRIGSHANAFLTITNLGTYDLAVHLGNFSPSVFSLVIDPGAISPSGNVQVGLVFTPTAEGIVTGMATVQSNDAKNSLDTIYFKGIGINSALDIPASVDFHELNINKTHDSVLTLKNLGTGGAKIFRYKLSDPDNGFVLVDTGAHAIAAKDSVTIKIRFAPKLEQTYAATVSVITDDGAAPTRVITLAGKGINSKLSADPSSIDFGTIDTGTSSAKTFTLTNTGSAATTITNVKITGSSYFTLGSVTLPLQIDAGANKNISVTFSPMAGGTFDGSAVITASEGSPISVSLHGIGKVKSIISVRATPEEIGLKMMLSPNPSNGSATIKLILAKPLHMMLALFDASGRLARGYEQSSFGTGEYSLPLATEMLASGEYYLRAIVGGVIAAETKVVVIR